MRSKFQRRIVATLGAVLMLCFAAITITAQQRQTSNIPKDKLNEAREEASKAAEVFREIMKVPEKAIPQELFERAEAIAVFPNVVKAAFIVGGRGGDGVISRRTANGWSAPAYFNISGGSFGAQIGVKSTDYVMLFMNEGGLKGLLEDKFEFGGDVSVAAGRVGRTLGAGTNLTLDAGILTYSRSEGVFIGASLKGAVLDADDDLNEAIYGMKARELLTGGSAMKMSEMPAVVPVFPQTLARYTTRSARGASMSSNDAAMTNASYSSKQGEGRDTQTRGQDMNREFAKMRSPERLAPEVRNELQTLPYYSVFDWIEFEVQPGGVVVLRGQVTSPSDTKSTAEAYVKDVEGVTRVINQIEVLPVSPTDQRLGEALYRAVYSGPLFRYQVGSLQSIHIIVENGRATLKGVVNSEADTQLVDTQARAVPGLFEVKNELVVRNGERRAR